MGTYATKDIRNIALVGHSGCGKTSLSEAMFFDTGAATRLGRVEDGTTVSDWDDEEKRRHVSINTAVIPCEWKGAKINLLDTPGYADFAGDVIAAVAVADAGLVMVDAVAGAEVGTELTWSYLNERSLPRLVVVNKMDRENANFDKALQSLREHFAGAIVALQVPIGKEHDFRGVVDLMQMKAFVGPKGEMQDIPANLQAEVDKARTLLIEAAAEGNDDLIMKYLEGEELTPEEIQLGLGLGIRAGSIVPVVCTAASANLGVQALMDALVLLAPSPNQSAPVTAVRSNTGDTMTLATDPNGPLAALVFKTVADPYVGRVTFFRVFSGTMHSDSRVFNSRSESEERIPQLFTPRGEQHTNVDVVVAGDIGAVAKLTSTITSDTLCEKAGALQLAKPSYPSPLFAVAISPKTKADSAKLGPALTRLSEEDPTLRWRQEPSTQQTILEGMGDTHIDIAIRRMESKFGVGVETAVPKVPYQESITKNASAMYRHKKQTGGAGQFGEVHLEVKPLARGAGFEYSTDRVFGGVISNSFFPSIEKGIKSVLESGAMAGYPVVDVRVEVFDGKMHPVDSKDIAFQVAGREAFKLAIQQANPVLLEPIMDVAITVPDEYMGDVLSDINTKRARVQGMTQERGRSIVTAQVPLAEMQRYATDLRSITQGRGLFTMTFSHYEVVPAHAAEAIIAEAKREAEKE
ncbi:elongation factor G [Candidatus Amarolinea aalborgensis]|jgi:elongation factor G|uniref:elongation factor G n=1 Tax=Candidatus Amarolinea aalborgensis TaxID=2249329 RepID=UPI003BF9DE5F